MTRELQRNLSKRGYRPNFAHRQTLARRASKVKPPIEQETWAEVEDKLTSEQWSPEQISGRCQPDQLQQVSHEWIYQHIYKDKQSGGELYKNLHCSIKTPLPLWCIHKTWRIEKSSQYRTASEDS